MTTRWLFSSFAVVLLAGLMLGCGSSTNSQQTPPPLRVAFVQTASSTVTPTGNGEDFTTTFSSPVTKGNTVVMVFWWMHDRSLTNPITGVTDSEGNTYQLALIVSAGINSSTAADILYYYAPNAKGGTADAVTIGTAAAAQTTQVSMVILEYSGISSVDAVNTTSNLSGSTISTGMATTTAAPEVVLGSLLITWSTPIGAGTGYNPRFSSTYFVVEDEIAGTAGSYDAVFSMPPPYPQYLIAIPSMVTFR
ncbi:MAG TPA: hypothetical protein VMG31_06780 [Verrucomicrobiae bacterium]|nr:hypothetical protein [Verrucomicrobiae bacterium]